jgi:serine/threonine protein kinase
MNQDLKRQLRPSVTAWVEENYSGASEVAPHSGQRFVFRLAESAVKLLVPLNVNERERCFREVSFLEKQTVPGLPEVQTGLTEVEIGGHVFLVYEETWIDAESVKDKVETHGPHSDYSDIILTEGSRILSEIHRLRVVHRDVSHGNVLIGDGTVSIVDLGLAKYLDLDPITRTSEKIKMTIAFASPEQITGGSSLLEPPTDVYSLALVAIFAYSGKLAFLADDEAFVLDDYLARMAHQDLVVDVSGLPEVIRAMLNPIAAYRPTAARVAEELR